MNQTLPPVERNPLKYHCAPNGAGADYIAETDFRRFIAYGLLRCFTDLSEQGFSDHALVDDEHRRCLREAFLSVVEGTLLFLWNGEFEIGQSNFDRDQFGEACEVIIGNSDENPGENETMWSWIPHSIHDDCIVFDLYCSVLAGPGNGGDPTTLFLSMEAIEDRQAVKAVIDEAREINADPYRTDYQREWEATEWAKVL